MWWIKKFASLIKDQKLTAVPYRLQNSWEEIYDVPIPWLMNWHTKWLRIQNLKFFNLSHHTKLLQPITKKYIYPPYITYTTIPTLQMLLKRDRIIRSFVLLLSMCSLFLVAGSGMAEELQNLPGANSANSTAGWFKKS